MSDPTLTGVLVILLKPAPASLPVAEAFGGCLDLACRSGLEAIQRGLVQPSMLDRDLSPI